MANQRPLTDKSKKHRGSMWTMFNPSGFSPGGLLMEPHGEQPESNELWDHGRMGGVWVFSNSLLSQETLSDIL